MNPNNIVDLDKKEEDLTMIILYLTLAIIFLLINLCISCFYHSKNMEIPGIFHWGALVLFLATCFGFNRWYEYQKVELHNSQAIVNSKIECSPSEQVKPTSNKDKEILILDKENKNIYKLDENTSKQIIELLNKQAQ